MFDDFDSDGRGFIVHEYLDNFGFISMNGRVYDPILGMFLSPDNYVQMPDYTQNFNRYSYGLNNPLMFTDPSGEFLDLALFLIGTAIMGGEFFGRQPDGSFDWGKAAKGAATTTVIAGTTLASVFIPGIPQALTSMGVTGFFPVGLATGGAAFANTALNTASTNWIMSSEFRPNWNASAIAGGLAFLGGGLKGFQHSKSLDYNPWTGRPYSNEKWLAMHADNIIAGGYADVTNFYNPEPARINYLGSPDEIFEGLYEWTDYLKKDNGSMYLRKTPYNKFYSISDVFDNLPHASNGGYGIAGDIKGKMLNTSDGNLFSLSIHRYSNNSIKGGSTMLKYLGADELLYKGGKYLDVRFYNGYRSANGSYNKVFTYSIYNENVYKRFFNAVFKFK